MKYYFPVILIQPRVVVTASCGLEPSRMVYYKPLLDEAIRLSSHKPSTCIVLQRDQVNVFFFLKNKLNKRLRLLYLFTLKLFIYPHSSDNYENDQE